MTDQGSSPMDGVPPSICEVLLGVLVEFGVHAEPPRGIKPPPLVVALYEAADGYYGPEASTLATEVYRLRVERERLRLIIADLVAGETAEEGTPQWYALRNARAALDDSRLTEETDG